MTSLRVLVLISLVTFSLWGCKNRKGTGDCTTPLISLSNNVTDKVGENVIDFTDLTLRVKANYSGGGNSNSFGMTMKMKKDSFIWVSVSVMLEVARAYITPDSFKLIDRINRKYYTGSVEQFEQFTGQQLTLTQLQNLLVANPVFALEGFKKMHDDLRNDFLQQTESGIINNMLLTGCFRPLESEFKTHQSNKSFVVDYKGFVKQKGLGQFPTQIGFNAIDSTNTYELNMEYTSILTDELQPIKFIIPSKYEKG